MADDMAQPAESVFISYRRRHASFIAGAIFRDLRDHGFDAFMDVESLNAGRFENVVLNELGARLHFLAILTPETAAELAADDPGDWVRREFQRALDLEKNVIPILASGYTFPGGDQIPAQLRRLREFNGLRVSHDGFADAMDVLRSRFLKEPTRQEIRYRTAEEHWELGAEAIERDDWHTGVYELSEAIRLNPRQAEYFYGRAIAHSNLENLGRALDDVNQTLAIDPGGAKPVELKFQILMKQGKTREALEFGSSSGADDD